MKIVEKKILHVICAIVFILMINSSDSHAFEGGAVLNILGEFGGSSTMPSISDEDLKKLGAYKMEGMTAMVAAVTVEAGYIFDTQRYLGFDEDAILSGIGVFGYLGVGQGYAGQISGSQISEDVFVDVFFNVHYMPVLAAGAVGKVYFFKNRLSAGLALGIKVIADTQPVYEMYSTDTETFPPTVGTIIVEDWMMSKMNAISFNFKGSIEYSIPLLDTLEVILGVYVGGNIYSPKYITMPPDLLDAAMGDPYYFDPTEPVDSYYINSIEYGLKVGLGLKL